MKKFSVLPICFLLSFLFATDPLIAQAAEIKGVVLSEHAKSGSEGAELPRITQGLRQKKVVFAWFSVYVLQIFSKNAKPDFSSIEKLRNSLSSGLPLIFTMTFVRDVGIEKIVEGFSDVLKANSLDVTQAPYSNFLAAIQKSGDIKNKQKFEFNFEKAAADRYSLAVHSGEKEIFSIVDSSAAVIDSFLNIWLGKPTDSGLEQLQGYLLKP